MGLLSNSLPIYACNSTQSLDLFPTPTPLGKRLMLHDAGGGSTDDDDDCDCDDVGDGVTDYSYAAGGDGNDDDGGGGDVGGTNIAHIDDVWQGPGP